MGKRLLQLAQPKAPTSRRAAAPRMRTEGLGVGSRLVVAATRSRPGALLVLVIHPPVLALSCRPKGTRFPACLRETSASRGARSFLSSRSELCGASARPVTVSQRARPKLCGEFHHDPWGWLSVASPMCACLPPRATVGSPCHTNASRESQAATLFQHLGAQRGGAVSHGCARARSPFRGQ